jgi:hypothetical protein
MGRRRVNFYCLLLLTNHWLGQGAVCFERSIDSCIILNFGGQLLPVEVAVDANKGCTTTYWKKKKIDEKNFTRVFFFSS